MENVVMGNLDGDIDRVAFNTKEISRIITRYGASLVSSNGDPGLFLELNGQIFPVHGPINKDDIKPYFIVLRSGLAFNASDYQILFNVQELPNSLLSGIDVAGRQHLCRSYSNWEEKDEDKDKILVLKDIDKKIETGDISQKDIEDLRVIIKKMKNNEFFELLTMEFSGRIKEVAKELISFRKDIQSKIEPDIVELASRDIPEASNQLEGINETLEDNTMKIMDINEAQMELANSQLKYLESFISGKIDGGVNPEASVKVIEKQIDILKKIGDRSLTMMEPLSFQDLVGQRIQRIIKLVRSMESRIEELIVSFGIKLKKHREDPTKTFEELNLDVDIYMSELKGPQREGEGLDQSGIDDLLDSL